MSCSSLFPIEVSLETAHGVIFLVYGSASQMRLRYSSLKEKTEMILGSAIWHPDGILYASVRKRHHHVIAAMDVLGQANLKTTRLQGFLTSHGRFVDREEAMTIALDARQLARPSNAATTLFSEDLWESV